MVKILLIESFVVIHNQRSLKKNLNPFRHYCFIVKQRYLFLLQLRCHGKLARLVSKRLTWVSQN